MPDVEQAKALIAQSCHLLDDEKFDQFLDLFADNSRYAIKTYSPDLRKDLAWLDLDRNELGTLLSNLSQHVRLPGRFLRHPSACMFEPEAIGWPISVTTTLLVIHTDLEGVSRVFAAGRYHDKIAWIEGHPRLVEREVRLDTRQFGPGSHIPI